MIIKNINTLFPGVLCKRHQGWIWEMDTMGRIRFINVRDRIIDNITMTVA